MSREAFSGAKVPEVYDDSVVTRLKVIMDELKVKSFPLISEKIVLLLCEASLILHDNYHYLPNL